MRTLSVLKNRPIILILILIALVGATKAWAQPARQAEVVVRLAENGDARAQTRLGFMFATGRGFPQNFGRAAYWYKRAAEQGEPDAQYLLANCFDLAEGVSTDWIQAYKWFNLSASRTKNENERQHRALMRDAVASKLLRSELDDAQRLSVTWRPVRER